MNKMQSHNLFSSHKKQKNNQCNPQKPEKNKKPETHNKIATSKQEGMRGTTTTKEEETEVKEVRDMQEEMSTIKVKTWDQKRQNQSNLLIIHSIHSSKQLLTQK